MGTTGKHAVARMFRGTSSPAARLQSVQHSRAVGCQGGPWDCRWCRWCSTCWRQSSSTGQACTRHSPSIHFLVADAGQGIPVSAGACRHRTTPTQRLTVGQWLCTALMMRQEGEVKAQHLVSAWLAIQAIWFWMQLRIEGVQHPPGTTDAKIQFQMLAAVPGQSRHPVTERQVQLYPVSPILRARGPPHPCGVTVNIPPTRRDTTRLRRGGVRRT